MNRRQALVLVMVALGGFGAGALGMRYGRTWLAALTDAADRQEPAGARPAPGSREDAPGRSGAETPGQDEKKLVSLTESQIKNLASRSPWPSPARSRGASPCPAASP